jgi:glucans biosynthesis protein
MLSIGLLKPGGYDAARAMRRRVLATLALSALCFANGALAFGFSDVVQRAKQLAAAPYVNTPTTNLPKDLQGLTHDQYLNIGFNPDKAWWRSAKLPFELAFFHQGIHFNQPVKINELVGAKVREIKFSPDFFDYGANKVDLSKLQGIGFAGFRPKAAPPPCSTMRCAWRR